jgi:hypothetical protein
LKEDTATISAGGKSATVPLDELASTIRSIKEFFTDRQMTLTKVMPDRKKNDDEVEPRFKLHLKLPLAPTYAEFLGIATVTESEALDHDKKIPLNPDALRFGDAFELALSAQIGPEKTALLTSADAVLEAANLKGNDLELVISTPVDSSWDIFGELFEKYVPQAVFMSIIPGPIQENLPFQDDAGELD